MRDITGAPEFVISDTSMNRIAHATLNRKPLDPRLWKMFLIHPMLAAAANANDLPPEETPEHRRARQLAYFRRLADLNMEAAEIAAERVRDAHAAGPDANTASPTLDLARATRGVTLAVNSENRVVRGEVLEPRTRILPFDRRRAPLQQALHPLAKDEPTPAARNAFRGVIDDAIDHELLSDPEGDIPIDEVLMSVCDTIGRKPDFSKLSDEVLGMPPRVCDPPPWANQTPKDRPEAFNRDQE